MILFPNINPVLTQIGQIEIRWYGIAYMLSFIFGYIIINIMNKKQNELIFPKQAIDSLVTYCVFGVIIGGRLGYIAIYAPNIIWNDPIRILKTWEGGMSFHGGLIGMTLAIYLLSKKYHFHFIKAMDALACVSPIGLFLGRIANFINAELYGRVTNVPWAIIFPGTDGLPRHPSQIYEALLEGLLLFIIVNLCYYYKENRYKTGYTSSIFLICYGTARFIIENYREPDEHIGFIFMQITMGQIVTLPFLVIGVILLNRSRNTQNILHTI